MFIGLMVTFGVGYYVSTDEIMLENIFASNAYVFIWIIEFIVVIVLSARIRKMSSMTAKVLFLLYSGLTGLTFSSIFVVFEMSSIIFVFAVTSIICLAFGLLGYYTKMDLTKISTYLFMALIGIILMSIINMFIGSESLDFGICILALIIFIAYMAYDVNMIKRGLYGIDTEDNLAIYGAFQLYLDFINVFIRLIQLFGNRRD
jgi:hypothetical protein